MANISQEQRNLSDTIRKNLRKIMKVHGLKVSNFCDYISNENEASMDRTNFTKYMNGQIISPNLAFLVSCSRIFNVSLDNLFSQNFDPYQNFQKTKEKFKEISDNDINNIGFDCLSNDIFVGNPNSSLFKKYMQPYFCYYYSTVASENNTDHIEDALISGELSIEECGNKCKAILKINTKIKDEKGNPKYKIYSGDVIICPSIQSVHCILTLPEGEFCFIIFRYSHLNINMQDCRLAEVLSTSSTPDKRYPVVHRMFLSREEIHEKDWPIIVPHLCMNSREILISEEGLFSLSELSDEYSRIVEEIRIYDSEPMYCISENKIEEISKKYLNPEKLPILITELRARSFVKRYNKVSTRADEEIHKVLLGRGYFADTK